MEYILPDELVDIVFDSKVVNFIKTVPAVALVCFIGWLMTNFGSFIYDCYKYRKGYENNIISYIFEEKEYDSSADEATEDDDTYYEINYVKVKRNVRDHGMLAYTNHARTHMPKPEPQSQKSGVTNTQGPSRQKPELQNQSNKSGVTNTPQGSSKQPTELQNQSQKLEQEMQTITNTQGSKEPNDNQTETKQL